jgi:hypothetical protein
MANVTKSDELVLVSEVFALGASVYWLDAVRATVTTD